MTDDLPKCNKKITEILMAKQVIKILLFAI